MNEYEVYSSCDVISLDSLDVRGPYERSFAFTHEKSTIKVYRKRMLELKNLFIIFRIHINFMIVQLRKGSDVLVEVEIEKKQNSSNSNITKNAQELHKISWCSETNSLLSYSILLSMKESSQKQKMFFIYFRATPRTQQRKRKNILVLPPAHTHSFRKDPLWCDLQKNIIFSSSTRKKNRRCCCSSWNFIHKFFSSFFFFSLVSFGKQTRSFRWVVLFGFWISCWLV